MKFFQHYISENNQLSQKKNIGYTLSQINEALKKYVFTDTLHTKVVKNIHGDSSGVRGAAWLS